MDKIFAVLENFNLPGSSFHARPIGSGLIHKTWFIKNETAGLQDYILQRINTHVFPMVDVLMDNISKVTTHIRQKHVDAKQGRQLDVIPVINGQLFFRDEEGNCWRMYNAIAGSCYDILPNPETAREAGQAFGQFVSDLADLPAKDIVAVIPDFHNIITRYSAFCKVVEADAHGRNVSAKEEIAYAQDHYNRLAIIARLLESNTIPTRITHNDTKLNNVIFDAAGKAVCVIDLDTVMPGSILYDFGDAIRTIANTTAEDEADLSLVKFDMAAFASFAQGYLEKTRMILTPGEVELLPLSCQYITYIMGLRFLTDYLDGDTYYPVAYSTHNKVRCQNQFQLIECMMEKDMECSEIISKLLH